MKKLLLICCLLIIFCDFSFAQDAVINDSTQKNKYNIQQSLYVEVLGSTASLYNFTYDCSFLLVEKNKISVATGIGYIPVELWGDDAAFRVKPHLGISLHVSYLYQKKNNNHFEVGSGIAFPEFLSPRLYRFFDERTYKHWSINPFCVFTTRIGYRYQSDDGGFFFKIAFTPMFSKDYFLFVIPNFGIAFGYTLENRN